MSPGAALHPSNDTLKPGLLPALPVLLLATRKRKHRVVERPGLHPDRRNAELGRLLQHCERRGRRRDDGDGRLRWVRERRERRQRRVASGRCGAVAGDGYGGSRGVDWRYRERVRDVPGEDCR